MRKNFKSSITRILIAIIFFIFAYQINAQITAYTSDSIKVFLYKDGSWKFASDSTEYKLYGLEIPKLKPTDELVQHQYYILSYNQKYEQANWVAYVLTKSHTKAKFKRNEKFIPDTLVKTGTADDADYNGSGYDRGHLAPAADMAWSKIAIKESFYFSNISPQVPGFNRGIWKHLEEKVREWAQEYNKLYIVTGPVLNEGLTKIGHDSVSVPKYFYKVVLDFSPGEEKAIGFILPNEVSKKNLINYAVPIDSVENVTNIDFFPALPDSEETKLESIIDLKSWGLKK